MPKNPFATPKNAKNIFGSPQNGFSETPFPNSQFSSTQKKVNNLSPKNTGNSVVGSDDESTKSGSDMFSKQVGKLPRYVGKYPLKNVRKNMVK